MDFFDYKDGQLHAEAVPLEQIAQQFGTPTYVYSRATLERHYRAYEEAFGAHPHLVCYAVKANANLAVLNVLARLGAGFDIVSEGELERVLAAGGDPHRVVFSGVGKQAREMRRALEVGVHCFNVESEAELYRLNDVALTSPIVLISRTGRRAYLAQRAMLQRGFQDVYHLDGGTLSWQLFTGA